MEYIYIGIGIVCMILLLIILLKPKDTSREVNAMKAYFREEVLVSMLERQNVESNESRKKLEDFERAIQASFNQRFDALAMRLDTKLSSMNDKVENNLSKGFVKTDDAYKNLIERLAKIDEAQNNITKLSIDVVSLKNTLENNQNRGKFGEFTLERILFSIFGDAKRGVYEFQYTIREDNETERPDAVVFLPSPNQMLCIDSKFPYQDYKRLLDLKDETYKKTFLQSVKKHIQDIATKYIIPGKTAKEALMFIPSDAVFGYICGELYEVVEFARNNNVVLTSPSTLQPILATINMVRIDAIRNENLGIIARELKGLGRDFKKFEDDWSKLSKNMNTVLASKDAFDKRVSLLNKKFHKIDSEHILDFEEESQIGYEDIE